MVRSKGWSGVAIVFAMFVASTVAQGALIGTAVLVKDGGALPFVTDTSLNSPPSNGWNGYILGLTSTSGPITGIDANITGLLHQRWTVGTDPDSGDPVITPTPNSTTNSTTTGDTHLLASANSLIIVPYSEDNNVNNVNAFAVPATDTSVRDYGVGSFLKGVWGIVAGEQSNTTNFAYVVVPKGQEPKVQLKISVGLPGGAFVALGNNDFIGTPFAVPEPASIALAGLATIGLIGMVGRRG